MGGTSTDVALIHGGIPEVSSELTIDYGLPIHVPMVDVRTVGAGGGSIAWVERGRHAAGRAGIGRARRPARSATGAAATRPTITDAHLLLGRLDPARLHRRRPARRASSRCALRSRREIAAPLGLCAGGCGGRRAPARQHAHGRRDPHGVAVARPRPARFRALRLRRRGAAACGRDRARARRAGGGGAGAARPHQRARLPGRRPAPGFRQHASTRRSTGSTCASWRRRLRAQRAEGERINAAEQDEIVETRRAARRRHAVPRPDASDPHRDSLAGRDARRAAGAVRGGLFRALPGAAAGNPRRAGQPGDVGDRPAAEPFRWRRLPADGAAMRATAEAGAAIYCRRGVAGGARFRARAALAPDARVEGPAIIEQFDATTVIEPGATATVDAVGNLRIKVGSGR